MDSAYVFFLFLGVSLLLLMVVNLFANKYLKGDFLKVQDEEKCEHQTDPDGNKYSRIIPLSDTSAAESDGQTSADDIDDDDDDDDNEVSNMQPSKNNVDVVSPSGTPLKTTSSPYLSAKLKLTLEYRTKTKSVLGCIRKVEGLDRFTKGSSYDRLCFHVSISNRPSVSTTKTKWKSVQDSHMLYSTFKIGPIEKGNDSSETREVDLTDETQISNQVPRVSIRLLMTKKTALVKSKKKCVGQCSVDLDQVFERNNCVIPTVATLLP